MAGSVISAAVIGLLLPLIGAPGIPPPKEGFCIACHSKEKDRRLVVPTTSVAASVHAILDAPCVACHGGDIREPTMRAHDRERGFRGKPSTEEVPRVCGGCHSDAAFMRRYSASLTIDQLALYRVSAHGQALAKGETDVATCISCHGWHNVKHITDPDSPVYPRRVADTCGKCHNNPDHRASKLGTGRQVELWKKSVHARAMHEKGDLSAPTCNDCHGSHGARPPGVSEVHNACGQCHSEQSERFMASPHAEAYRRLGFAECAECHSNHNVMPAGDELLLPKEGGVCRRCHDEGTKGYTAAAEIYARLKEANKLASEAREVAAKARVAGLLIPDADVAETELYTGLTRMQVAVHGMRANALDGEFAMVSAAAEKMSKAARAAEGDLKFRRNGYLGFIALIATMVVLLVVKLRRLGRA
jgi:predicted CXXCH cytochrome family protein